MVQREETAAADGLTHHPLLVVISGPSGVGKDSAVAELKGRGHPWHFAVTATTRPPRVGERQGIDYLFLDHGEFQELRETNRLLECVEYSGSWYGVPRSQVEEALEEGQDVFLVIDVRGAESIRELAPEAILIFLAPVSLDELSARLTRRRTEAAEEVQRRLTIARQEMAQMARFDYCVVNREGCLEQAVEDIEAIIVAEKCRVARKMVSLAPP